MSRSAVAAIAVGLCLSGCGASSPVAPDAQLETIEIVNARWRMETTEAGRYVGYLALGVHVVNPRDLDTPRLLRGQLHSADGERVPTAGCMSMLQVSDMVATMTCRTFPPSDTPPAAHPAIELTLSTYRDGEPIRPRAYLLSLE